MQCIVVRTGEHHATCHRRLDAELHTHDRPPVAASNATSRPSAVGTNTVPSATAAGALIAAPTDAAHWTAPVAGSSAYIVPAFVPTYSASPSTGDTDEVPSSGVLQSGI
jgi:hypothetical protein